MVVRNRQVFEGFADGYDFGDLRDDLASSSESLQRPLVDLVVTVAESELFYDGAEVHERTKYEGTRLGRQSSKERRSTAGPVL